jgi:hypothetical protein
MTISPLLVAGLIGLVVAYLLTPVVGWLATQCGVVAKPGGRHIHARPVARLGGVAVYAAFVSAVVVGVPVERPIHVAVGAKQVLITIPYAAAIDRPIVGLLLGATLITLLGAIVAPRREVLAGSAALAARLRPFMLRLEEIDYLDEYFRSLFVRVAPSRPLLRAYAEATVIFGCHDQRPFMPHLSLLYGDFSPRLKEVAKSEWGPRLDLSFKARSLYVYSTYGEPERWRRIARYGFN